MPKCPVCGHETGKKINYQVEISKMVSNFSENSRKELMRVVSDIMSKIPSDSEPEKAYFFIKAIFQCKEKAVLHSIRNYSSGPYVNEGKGFQYLKAIILKYDKDWDTLVKNEMYLGVQPPVVSLDDV